MCIKVSIRLKNVVIVAVLVVVNDLLPSADMAYQLDAGVKIAVYLRFVRFLLEQARTTNCHLLCLRRFLLINAKADVAKLWQRSLLVNTPSVLDAVDPNGRFSYTDQHCDLVTLINDCMHRLSNALNLQQPLVV